MGKKVIEGRDPRKDKGKRKIYSHGNSHANPDEVKFNEETRKWEINKTWQTY